MLSLAKLVDGRAQVLVVHACILQDGRCRTLYIQDGENHGFQGHILVAQSLTIFYGLLEHLIGASAQVRFSTRNFWERHDLSVEYHCYLLAVHS